MYAQKTTLLFGDLLREKASSLRVVYVNYIEDKRNPDDVYSTHNPTLAKNISSLAQFPLLQVRELSTILHDVDKYDVFGIDEGQFYEDLYEVVTYLVNKCNKIVYVTGLDSDSNRKKFGQLVDLVPMADSYEKVYARCMRCAHAGVRANAVHTLRSKSALQGQKLIGATDVYEAVCRNCYNASL